MRSVIDHWRVIAVGLGFIGLTTAVEAGVGEASLVTTFVGYARDRGTDALLYKEIHSQIIRADGGVELEVIYVAPTGETIATYRAEPSGDPFIPETRFEDHRWGTSEGVRREGGATVLFRKRSASDDRVDEKRPTCSDRPVADAGLGHLMESNWERLLAGERVVAELLIPQRLRCLRFSLVKTDEWSLDDEPVVTIDMAFTNPLIRLLAGVLRFTYHRDQRFMVRFEGKSRLVDESGDNYVVQIDFPMAERSERAAERPAVSTGGSDG